MNRASPIGEGHLGTAVRESHHAREHSEQLKAMEKPMGRLLMLLIPIGWHRPAGSVGCDHI